MVDNKSASSTETLKAANATVVIHKPSAGQNVVIPAHEGMQFQPGFNPADADLTVKNGDLIFTFKDGATVTLDNFAELKELPNIIMPDGSIVAGNVIVAQLTAGTDEVFNLETAAGGGANGGGGHNYSDDLGSVIDLLNGVPPLPPTFLYFSVPEAEDFNPALISNPPGGDFEPGTFTAYLQGTAGGYEDWQPAQNTGDLTEYPMQVKINFTPDDNEVVDSMTISEIPDGVRLFVGDQTNGFTEITLVNGSYTVTTAELGGQGIFMMPPNDSDADITFNVSIIVRDPDTDQTIVLTKDVTAVIDAVADMPELAGSITVGAVTDTAYVSGSEGDLIALNLNVDFNDHDGSEVHTITMAGIPQEWTLVSDSGLGFVGTTAVDNGDGTVTYSVTYTGDFNGAVTFNPNEWTSLGANATGETGNITVTAKAVETALSGGEITLENNTAQVSTTFRVNLSEDVPEIILISGPAALAEPDLLIPGADIDTNTITVDFFSDAPGSIALTTEGLAALNLTSQGEVISYVLSANGLVITAVDEGGNTVFTVTLDPNATVNGTQQTFTYSFELMQPVDHPDTTTADITDIPVHFTATDSDGDHANGVLHLTIADDVPVLSNSTLSMDESDDIGHVFNGSVHADLGADGYGSVVGTGSFTSSDANLTSDGYPVTVTYANGVYTGTANGVTVFVLTLAATGTYTFVQSAAIDHDNTASNNENTSMTFGVRATDYDGDTTTAVITVNIRDDGPSLQVSAVTVDETSDLGIAATGSITASYGADGAGSLDGNGSFEATGSIMNGALASGGHAVDVSFNNGVYTGTADGSTVFTLTLQPNGQYSFVQYGALDHADGANPNDSMALRFGVTVTDGDGDSVSDFITVNVHDDAPVAHDDHNSFVGLIAEGNVITGENGGIGAADIVGQDEDGFLTQVSFGSDVKNFATDGLTDANGTYVTINGDHGVLKIYNDGDYVYTLTGPGASSTTTETKTFFVDPTDITGTPESVTENGITVSVGQGGGTSGSTKYLAYFNSSEASGLGMISQGSNDKKIYTTGDKIETVEVSFEKPSAKFEVTLQDIGPNNAGRHVDFNVTYQKADGSTYSKWTELTLPNPATANHDAVLSLSAPEGEAIVKFEIGAYDVPSICDSSDTVSMVIKSITAYYEVTTEIECADKFNYTLSDYDGDISSAQLTFCAQNNGEAPQVTISGGTGYVAASFFNMDDDAIAFPILKEGKDIDDRATDANIAHMVNTAETLDINFPTTLTITYVESDRFVAGYDNSFGVYIMQDDGTIANPELLWGSMSSNNTNPLADGTQFTYQIPEGITGTAGFFIIKDGFDLMKSLDAVNSDGSPTGDGEFKFAADGNGGYNLYYTVNGVDTLIETHVFHSLNQVEINPDGQTHAIAGLTESGARDVAMIGFEDLYGDASKSDRDFNDVMFTVTVNPIGDVNLVTGPLLSGFDISDSDSTQMSEVKVDVTGVLSRDGVYFDFGGTDYSLVGSNLYNNGSDTGIDASIVKDASGIHVLLTGLGATADYEAAVSHISFESAADPMSSIGVRSVSVDVTDDFGNTTTVNTTYTVTGPVASDHIFIADASGETVTGTAGQDMFVGTSGDDTFIGAQGNDLFFAGSGNDTLTGGQGADYFVFQNGATGTDTITDYNAAEGDVLNIADLLTESTYTAGTSDVHDFVMVDSTTGDVLVDTAGTGNFGSGAAIAHLNGISSVSTVNFILDNDEGPVIVTPIA